MLLLRIRMLAVAGALGLLAGCANLLPAHDNKEFETTAPSEAEAAPADGSIYHDVHSLELFSDPRAHRVGDILTVMLMESTQASKKATTTTSKSDKVAIDAPTILGQGLTLNGKTANITTNGQRSFNGDGSSSQSNQLTGAITVTVAQRLSNGNLLVRGEKMLSINQGQELVRISGIVRPQDIGSDNTIASTRVANAHIGYSGRGSLADANTQGWLSRFFSSKWMPF